MMMFTFCRPRKLPSRAIFATSVGSVPTPAGKPLTAAQDSLQIVKPTLHAHSLTYCTLAQKDWWTRGLTRIRRALALKPQPNLITSLSSAAMDTKASGSTMLVCIAKGNISGFTQVPTDNRGNWPYLQLGPTHSYSPQYPGSGSALYAMAAAKGGTGHIITTDMVANDEITMVAVEVKNGGVIQDYKWNAVPKGNPLTSLSVTTTGPATLVAFWWGDGNETLAHRAVPNNGFTVIDSLLPPGLLVQTALATKDVTEAGSYHVTWDSGGLEGAQLYLIAVQSGPLALRTQGAESNLVISQSLLIK